ncbi:interleukin-18 receptor accessory protein isoform X1 [Mixophyes fleayi]|uniref:interleukin-18 receptor accessory protein isoform X1 n=1 Tax=Mixophyes fleayi TaxID=3061075 RepID=UPI003F4E4502
MLLLGLFFLFCNIKHTVLAEFDVSGFSNCLDGEPNYRYQVFAEENVFFQCNLPFHEPLQIYNKSFFNENKTQWFLQKPDRSIEEIDISKNFKISNIGRALWFSPVEMRHSGTYLCRTENMCMQIRIHVQPKENCTKYGPSSHYFTTDIKGSISCPSLNCQQGRNISNLRWYKTANFEDVQSPNRFSLAIINDIVHFNVIYTEDAGTYICDYLLYIDGKEWIVRATTEVDVGVQDTQSPPEILGPSNGTEIKAELGKPLNLTCRILFRFERYFNPLITWTLLYPNSKEERFGRGDLCTTHFEGNDCFFTITLNKVTMNDFKATFYCHAQNSVGNASTMVKLSRKERDFVFLVYVLCATVLLLLLLLAGSGMVYLNWIEIVLFYRNYLSNDETIGDDKEFDAFISYATHNSEFSEETRENYCKSYDEEQFATQMLPNVLENNYNYKLCILERDILPGGAYVEDIAKIIKRSRRAIFILSQRYITGPSLFELQAAITCSVEKEDPLKLILIKFSSFKEPESIPHVVKKALKTLPMVSWKGDVDGKFAQNTQFWNRVRYYMPVKKSKNNGKI